jgi:hypothetical protein
MICSIPKCSKLVFAKGWCNKHYTANYRYGNPLYPVLPRTSAEELDLAIERAIKFVHNYKCFIWPYYRDANSGYASRGKGELIHRIVCEAVHGKAPPDKPLALHDNGRNYGCGPDGCVNPWHLRWGSKQEDADDRIRQGVQVRGETDGNHKLIENEVKEIRILYNTGKYTQNYLASKFNVTQATISLVLLRRIWKHI